MSKIFTFIFSFLSITGFGRGEIAFISYDANPDTFRFILLVDFPANYQLNFTDMGYNSTGVRTGNEGVLRWTSPSTILPAGTIVTINVPTPSTPTVSTGTITAIGTNQFALSTTGDQITAFFIQNGTNAEMAIASLHFGTNGFSGDPSISTAQTQLPPGLTAGTNALDLGARQEGYFNCSGGTSTGTQSQLLSAINTAANWTTQTTNAGISPSACSFSVTSPALPVNLISFSGSPFSSNINLLWQTNREINNDYFEIQRSRTGQNFETIGRVNGQGDYKSSFNYTFFDEQPIIGQNYYRLKQNDFDGSFAFSKIINVFFEPTNYISIYPNPIKEGEILQIEKAEKTKLSQITNTKGQLIYTNIEQLKRGQYVLHFITENQQKISKHLIVE